MNTTDPDAYHNVTIAFFDYAPGSGGDEAAALWLLIDFPQGIARLRSNDYHIVAEAARDRMMSPLMQNLTTHRATIEWFRNRRNRILAAVMEIKG